MLKFSRDYLIVVIPNIYDYWCLAILRFYAYEANEYECGNEGYEHGYGHEHGYG